MVAWSEDRSLADVDRRGVRDQAGHVGRSAREVAAADGAGPGDVHGHLVHGFVDGDGRGIEAEGQVAEGRRLIDVQLVDHSAVEVGRGLVESRAGDVADVDVDVRRSLRGAADLVDDAHVGGGGDVDGGRLRAHGEGQSERGDAGEKDLFHFRYFPIVNGASPCRAPLNTHDSFPNVANDKKKLSSRAKTRTFVTGPRSLSFSGWAVGTGCELQNPNTAISSAQG
ncbi:MAG: hypothetical protein JWN64_828 [Parcubacteria group bacterium]|nr:hypothetical protein [Parcubacteria group bacterium]